MKKLLSLLTICFAGLALADTPPPGTVKAKMFSGDGNTAITATGSALNVNVVSGGGGATLVDQGAAGSSPWVAAITSSVLPSNACKETGGHLASIDSKLTNPLPVSGTFWQDTQPVSGTLTCNAGTGTLLVDASAHAQPVTGTFWQATQPVSIASLPALATGSNTIGAVNINGTVPVSGTITTTNTANGDPGSSAPSQATQVGGIDGGGALRTLKVATDGSLTVDGSAVTQPVSGTVTANAGSGTFAVSGTVTANAGSGTFLVDGSANPQPVTGTFWQATQPVSGTFFQATQPVSAAALPLPSGASTESTLSSLNAKVPSNLTVSSTRLLVDGSGVTQPVSVASLPLPSGAATETTLASIDTKTPVLGQALAAASVPVVLTASQLSTLTPLSTVTANAGTGTFTVNGSGFTQPVSGTFWQATQPVSIATAPVLVAGSAIIGKVGIDQTTPGTTNGVQVNAALPAGANVIGHVIVDSGSTTAATQSGTWNVNATPVVPTAVTVKQAAITIGTSAVRLTTDGSAPSSTRTVLMAQLLSSSTAACFMGSSGVTSSSTTRGVQMFAGQTYSFSNDAGDYYAICDASSQTFLVTEQE